MGSRYSGFDIYGNDLLIGHCEVHPAIAEEYPCHQCLKETNDREYERLVEAQIFELEEAQIAEYERSLPKAIESTESPSDSGSRKGSGGSYE